MKKRLPLLLTLFFCSALSFTYAQDIIKGTVTDKKNGEPLIGSTISLKNQATGKKIYLGVGLDGTYIFKNIADGSYEVQAEYVSYQSASKDVTVEANATVVVNLALED